MRDKSTFSGYYGRFFGRLRRDAWEWPRDNIFLAFAMVVVPPVAVWLRDPTHAPDWAVIKVTGWIYLSILIAYLIVHAARTPWKLDADQSDALSRAKVELAKEKARNEKPDLGGEIEQAMIGPIRGFELGDEKGAVVLLSLRTWNKIQMPDFSVHKYEVAITVNSPSGPSTFAGTQEGWTINVATPGPSMKIIPIARERLRPMRYIDPQNGAVGFFVKDLPDETVDFLSIVLTLVDAVGGRHPISFRNGKFVHDLIVGQKLPGA
jgi:hypothetical protein